MATARFIPSADFDDVIASACDEQVGKVAERIARNTVTLSAMASRHAGRYGRIVVTRLGKARQRVAALGSLAHLDEWGSANNSPKASMRRAAMREGTFRQESR